VANPTKLVSSAGEHYVIYKLSSFGMSVALTHDCSDVIDLLVGDLLQGTTVAIKVKTVRKARKSTYWEWSVGRKPLDLKDSKLFYVFIDLKVDPSVELPTVFIVPVADVARKAIDAGFKEQSNWKPFHFKISEEESSKYLEKWGLITKHVQG
jgi:hypothetical protein